MEWVAKLLPEIWLTINILLFLAFVGYYKTRDDFFVVYNLFNFSNIITLVTVSIQMFWIYNIENSSLDLFLGNMVIYSNGIFEITSKFLIAFISIFIVMMFNIYFGKGQYEYKHDYFRPDILPLFFIIVLGSFVLISSNDFLTFLIGFELVAIPSYFMIAMDNRNPKALEGSIKYFLIGSLATISVIISILLFYIYSGSFVFEDARILVENKGIKLAFIFLSVGIFIKLALFPFSFWIQDAYEGSRSPYLIVISSVPKISVLIIFIKLLSLFSFVSDMLFVFCLFSMLFGTFWALSTNSIKKILAFSTITNIGYALIPFVSIGNNFIVNSQSFAVSYFYIFQYVLSTVLFIGVLMYLEEKYGVTELDILKGALRSNSILSLFLLISLLSMAGLPPTVGFIAKFLLFSFSYHFNPFLVWVGIITSVISLYFYYKIAYYLYVSNDNVRNIEVGFLSSFSNSILSFLIVFWGFFPGFIISIIYFISLSLLNNMKM